jgi:hypothetical protein
LPITTSPGSRGSRSPSPARWWAPDRTAGLAIDLRARLRRLAAGERVEHRRHALERQILEIVVVDLDHRRVRAGAEALDLAQREETFVGDLALLQPLLVAGGEHVVRALEHARRGPADLHVKAPTGLRLNIV